MADAATAAIARIETDQTTRESDRRVRIQRLRGTLTQLEGDLATAGAAAKRSEYEVERRVLRAPIDGRIAEAADLRVGAVVDEGDRLAAIVPASPLRIVAQFAPASAIGRVRVGQPARVRLLGFPWAEYGSLQARVTAVADELRDGLVRVELGVGRPARRRSRSATPCPAASRSRSSASAPLAGLQISRRPADPAGRRARRSIRVIRVPTSVNPRDPRPVTSSARSASRERSDRSLIRTLTWPQPARTSHDWLAPEVVQTSAMDCGPAALKCLLDGFGLPASYGRLREACQTDVDGTSIDTLEDLANDVGLIAEQTLLPLDHVIVSAATVLPAIVVVRQPGGLLHFVVAWRRHGPLMQVMDPATGRRWPRATAFTDELYEHTMPVPADAWRSWAESTLYHDGLRARAHACGLSRRVLDGLLLEASQDQGWHGFATVDATLRMIAALRRTGGFSRARCGPHASRRSGNGRARQRIRLPSCPRTTGRCGRRLRIDGREHVLVRGAVLVSVTRRATGGRPGAQRGRAATRAWLPRCAKRRSSRPDISCPCCEPTGFWHLRLF